MSSNESRVRSALHQAFIAPDGALRAVWRFAAVLIVWHIVVMLAAMISGDALSALFDSWGVDSKNLGYAPMWVQYLAAYRVQLFHLISAVIAAVGGRLLTGKVRTVQGYRMPSAMGWALGAFIGIFAATALALLFYATDSMRFESLVPMISVDMAVSAAVSSAIALGEGMLAFGYVRGMVTSRGGRAAGYICAAIMYIMMEGAYLGGIIPLMNAFLMATALCLVSEKLGLGAAVGLRGGWLWAVSSLAAFPGSGTAMLRLYPVSENILTGGENGPEHGLMVTLVLGVILWLAIARPAVRRLSAAIRQNCKQA